MSEWGDDPFGGDPFEVDDEPETSAPAERVEPGRAFGVDLAQVAGDLVAASFQKAIHQRVAAAVAETVEAEVEQIFDDEVLDDLGRRAETAAAEAVERELAAMAAADDDEEPEPTLYFGSVDEFVREYLIGAYRRRIDGQRNLWPARWWEYDEAVIRLEALWRSWEMLRQDPSTGMSVWWRDHADHHMAVLLSSDGPFAGCEPEAGRNSAGEPLPYERPPADLFPDVRVSAEDASQTAT